MAKIFLDLDAIPDCRLSISTRYSYVSTSNPSANYGYRSGIWMENEADSVAWGEAGFDCLLANAFPQNGLISGFASWARGVVTFSTGEANFPCWGNTFDGDTYYGFKLMRPQGVLYGWLLLSLKQSSNTLTLKEYAINFTPGNPIRAGQK